MKNRRWVGIVLLVVGIAIAGVSLAADTVMYSLGVHTLLHVVADGSPGFGRSQIIAVIVGAIVAVVGLFFTLKSRSP